jgi:hypothetical protein
MVVNLPRRKITQNKQPKIWEQKVKTDQIELVSSGLRKNVKTRPSYLLQDSGYLLQICCCINHSSLSAMISTDNFGYILLGCILFSRTHSFRYFRPYKELAVIVFVATRFILHNRGSPTEDKDLLTILQEWIALVTPYFACFKGLDFLLKDLLFFILLHRMMRIFYTVTTMNLSNSFSSLMNYGFEKVKHLSFVQSMLNEESMKMEETLDKDLKAKSRAADGSSFTTLPEEGFSHGKILSMIESSIKSENRVWENGQLSGSVYGGQKEHIAFLNQCFSFYSIANVLHPDIWPSVMKYESEIIAMTASLVNGGNSLICGSTSSVSTVLTCDVLFMYSNSVETVCLFRVSCSCF